MSKKDPFATLFDNVRRMGAPIQPVRHEKDELEDWEDLTAGLEAGIEIDIHDLDIASDYGGLLSYKGRQVLLYIPDHSFKFDETVADPSIGNKYHVADCSTLQNMRRDNRIERYTATTNRDRKFDIYGGRGSGNAVKASVDLKICKNCLGKTNYKGYLTNGDSNKQAVFGAFDRDEFFQTYSSLFPFPIEPLQRMTSGYPINWRAISEHYRKSKNYTCEDCKVNLEKHRSLLHTHHINGVKSDVKGENLRALCVDCHRRQKYHDHMKVSASEIMIIRGQRRSDRVDVPTNWDQVFMLSDPAFHGALYKMKSRGYKIPRIAFEYQGRGSVFILEVCWPDEKRAVVKDNYSKVSLCSEGWTVCTLYEVL